MEVEHEVLNPLRRSLSNRDKLGGLQVRISKRWLALPMEGEGREVGDNLGKLSTNQVHGFPGQNKFGVICYETAGRTQMNNTRGSRGNGPKGVDMLS